MIADTEELEPAVKLKNLDDVIEGAKICIKGKPCNHHCPYWNGRLGRCVGDFRKDLLQWVLYLRRINHVV